jgi:hypothetical protein
VHTLFVFFFFLLVIKDAEVRSYRTDPVQVRSFVFFFFFFVKYMLFVFFFFGLIQYILKAFNQRLPELPYINCALGLFFFFFSFIQCILKAFNQRLPELPYINCAFRSFFLFFLVSYNVSSKLSTRDYLSCRTLIVHSGTYVVSVENWKYVSTVVYSSS